MSLTMNSEILLVKVEFFSTCLKNGFLLQGKNFSQQNPMKISWNVHVIYMEFDYKLNLLVTNFKCRQMTWNSNRKRLSLSNTKYFYDFVGQCNASDIAFAFHVDRIGRRKQTLLERLFCPMEGHGISMEIAVTFFPGYP